ncbi:hypothetical protein [Larkinella terrae]|uniref:Head-tail adaptor protein n=1 Tax=Larkinella terrae TaxID=2025311 RepID=A0A7K0EJT0_9BACT|nr:hypothetical protein [Larkinella terrae]MRS61781.1 hypothetical protein [Larkinella terrae]
MIRDRIVITRSEPVSDGAGGWIEPEDAEPILDTKAEVREVKPTQTLENLQNALKRAIVCKFWGKPADLQAGDTLLWGGQKWALLGPPIPSDATRRVYELTATQQ